jgi:hypothetical protein
VGHLLVLVLVLLQRNLSAGSRSVSDSVLFAFFRSRDCSTPPLELLCTWRGKDRESGEESSRRTCAYTSFQLLSALGPVVAGSGKDFQAGFIKACWLRC